MTNDEERFLVITRKRLNDEEWNDRIVQFLNSNGYSEQGLATSLNTVKHFVVEEMVSEIINLMKLYDLSRIIIVSKNELGLSDTVINKFIHLMDTAGYQIESIEEGVLEAKSPSVHYMA